MTPLRAAVKADEDEALLWTPPSTVSSRGTLAASFMLSPANLPYRSVASIRWPHFFTFSIQTECCFASCGLTWRLVKDAPCGGFKAMANV